MKYLALSSNQTYIQNCLIQYIRPFISWLVCNYKITYFNIFAKMARIQKETKLETFKNDNFSAPYF